MAGADEYSAVGEPRFVPDMYYVVVILRVSHQCIRSACRWGCSYIKQGPTRLQRLFEEPNSKLNTPHRVASIHAESPFMVALV